MAKKPRGSRWVQVLSFVIHGGAFAGVAAISTGHVPAPIAVMMAEVVQPEAVPEPPPPPPAAAEPAPRQTRDRGERAAADPSETPSDGARNAAPDYGIALDGVANGVGGGGIGVPIGDPGGVRRDSNVRPSEARVLAPVSNEPRRDQGCREDEVPPRPRRLRVNYTDEAQRARVEGRVRISVSLDEDGRVTDASILTPLGHGLDESALASVRTASFDPATRCGRSVASTFVIGVRYQL